MLADIYSKELDDCVGAVLLPACTPLLKITSAFRLAIRHQRSLHRC